MARPLPPGFPVHIPVTAGEIRSFVEETGDFRMVDTRFGINLVHAICNLSKVDDKTVELLDWVLENGAAVDFRNSSQATPLINIFSQMWATSYGEHQPAFVETLIRHGADVNAVSATLATPLGMAVSNASTHIDAVNQLIDAGAKIEGDIQNRILPPIFSCVIGNARTDFLDLLVSRGAKVDALNTSGCTALQVAASSNRAEMARALIRLGADVNFVDSAGHTPLSKSIFSNKNEGATLPQILLEAGADMNRPGPGGKNFLDFLFGYKDWSLSFPRRLDIAMHAVIAGADLSLPIRSVSAKDGELSAYEYLCNLDTISELTPFVSNNIEKVLELKAAVHAAHARHRLQSILGASAAIQP